MLEIENEKFENETREKDEKITDLENKATQLTEKVLMLKFEVRDQENKGQQMEIRFKDELKDLSDELEVLKKKKHDLMAEQENREERPKKQKPVKNRVSIMVMGVELAEFKSAQKKASWERERMERSPSHCSVKPLGSSRFQSVSSFQSSLEKSGCKQK